MELKTKKTSPNVSLHLAEKLMVNIKAKIDNNEATIYDGIMNDFVKNRSLAFLK
jgi:hypothetical protein